MDFRHYVEIKEIFTSHVGILMIPQKNSIRKENNERSKNIIL